MNRVLLISEIVVKSNYELFAKKEVKLLIKVENFSNMKAMILQKIIGNKFDTNNK